MRTGPLPLLLRFFRERETAPYEVSSRTVQADCKIHEAFKNGLLDCA